MKRTAIVLNVAAAVGFVALGGMARAIHDAHTYSTYREFVVVGAINEKELQDLPDPGRPEKTGYDMQAKMQQAGNVKAWITLITRLAAVACVLNAVLIQLLMRNRKQQKVGNLS